MSDSLAEKHAPDLIRGCPAYRTYNPEPERSLKAAATNPEPRTPNPEPGTMNYELM